MRQCFYISAHTDTNNTGGITLKKTILLISVFMLLFSFSCSKTVKYRNDLSSEEVMKSAPLYERSAETYDMYDKDFLDFFFEDIPTSDCVVLYSASQENIDEFGIFHAADTENTAKISESVEKYLSEMKDSQRAFIESYAAEELPKLDTAEMRIYGNYVAYAILSPEEMSAFFEHVENTLKE